MKRLEAVLKSIEGKLLVDPSSVNTITEDKTPETESASGKLELLSNPVCEHFGY